MRKFAPNVPTGEFKNVNDLGYVCWWNGNAIGQLS